MPYNKGDFTQQGVAGYVNGGLLLNNKRDVTTRISTDEESAGIDSVDIKIKDRLNDIEYHITGENLSEGENVIGGGGGSSDISISEVTLVSSDGLNYSTFVQMAQFDNLEYHTGVTIDENDGFTTAGLDLIVTGEPQIVNVIIMPNKYICAACPPGVGISDFIVTGNAEVDTVTEEGTTIKYVKIYGTCSITLVP